MNIKERLALAYRRENERFGDIYDECQKQGCDLDFLKAFANRIWMYPVLQTRCFIDSKAREQLDRFRKRKIDTLEQWKIYLSTLTKLRPNEDKAGEWEESIAVIDYYKETGKYKDSEPFGFWLIRAGENEYTDILIEQNGEDSKIISFLDSMHESITNKAKGNEEAISNIRDELIKNGFSKQVKQCDEEFVSRYKP